MAVYQALLLNTAVPQIQAAQDGDSYVMVVNSSTDALRITQTGAGNALVVEDSTNPDATPFVVTAVGDVGVGTSSPTSKLSIGGGLDFKSYVSHADNFALYANSTDGTTLASYTGYPITFRIANTEKMRLDTSGNLGLGVTPSAWGGAGVKAIDLGTVGNVYGSGADLGIVTNAYYNGSNWIYKTGTGGSPLYASRYQAIVSSGVQAWFTAPQGVAGNTVSFTQAMTLDASGNLLVGATSSLGYRSQVFASTNGYTQALVQTSAFNSGNLSGTVYSGFYDGSNITDMASIRGGKENTTSGNFGGMLAFYTRPNGGSDTERARITSGGEFLVGTTVTGLTGGGVRLKNGGGNLGEIALSNNSGSADYVARFLWGSSATLVGNITVDATSTAYNTSSDYRLKDNPQPLTNSGAFIDALKPKTWDWKSDGSKGVGFIAHEVQEVSPKTVHGVKDAVDEDGNPVYQAMEYGSAEFIANIVAELQSLRARVAQLEAK